MRILFRKKAAAFAAIGFFALTSCGEEQGEAVTGNAESQIPATSQPTTTTSQNGLSQISGCDLLSEEEAATISKGLKSEDKDSFAGAASVCTWNTSIDRGVPIEKGITFGISIRPSQSVAEVSVRGQAQVSDEEFASRTAKLVAENDGIEGSCLFSFAVAEGRVDITAESKNTKRSCTAVEDVATIIEPKLPD
ncbi:DUF3558 family protein [Haloechinothrix halophila]|uniref:DUF3558 family protein n=1 Tax=Haloechinothrix halophila TaxID=1069073 RepID=UPI0009FCB96E|nr:DUF3558 family protein [Haloechinothrix halophila]